jgi:photosystem II stability/assembly factor-like uncharacterized protein
MTNSAAFPISRLLLAALATSALCAALGAQQPVPIGPLGGSTSEILGIVGDPNQVLAVKFPQGLVRSIDGGQSFDPASNGLPAGALPSDLAAHPGAPTVLYALVGAQVWRSLDGGANWGPQAYVASGDLNHLAFGPGGGLALATSSSQIFRSDTSFALGAPVYSGTLLGNALFAPSSATRAYAATFNGIARSNDQALSFAIPSTSFTQWCKAVAVDPANADIVYAGTTNGVWKSVDGALGFTKLAGGLPSFASVQFFAWESSPARLWVGLLDGLYFTTDGGTSWNAAMSGLPQPVPLIEDLSFGGGVRWLATEEGVFRSSGAQLAWTHTAFAEVELLDAAIAAPGGERLASSIQGVYRAQPNALLQPSALFFDFGGHTDVLAVDPLDPTRVLAGGVGAFIDNAVVRVLAGAQVTNAYEQFGAGRVRALAFDPFDPTRVVGGVWPAGFGNAGLIRSFDSGASFDPISGTAGWSCRALSFDPFTPGLVLALFDNNQRAQSTDGGASWTLLGAWPGQAPASRLAHDPFRRGTLYRIDAAALWRSLDFGASWTACAPAVGPLSDLELDPRAPGVLFLSDASGQVLRSADRGASFELVLDVPNAIDASGLALDLADGALLVATRGASAFEAPFASPYALYGTGTPGSAGLVPRHYGQGGFPHPGNTSYQLAADRLRPQSVAWLYLGAGQLELPLFGGIALAGPPDLFFAGKATGGNPAVAGSGGIAFTLPIPADPELVGLPVYSQVIAFDSGGPQGFAFSRGLATTLGF